MSGAPGPRVVQDPSRHLDARRVLEVLRQAFVDLAGGRAVQPEQTRTLLAGGGDVITYQAALGSGVHGVKVSPYLPQSDPAPPVVTAWTLLMSTTTGQPLLLVEAKALTALRTAATSALAVQALAPPGASRLAVVGAGPVAQAHLRHVPLVRDFTDVRVASRTLERARAAAADVPGAVALGDVDDAVRGADVVLLCTSAAEAVIDITALAPGTVVVSVSTNAELAREIDPAAVPHVDVYCDHTPDAVSAAGELVLAARDGWDPSQVRGDLSDLLTGRAQSPRGDRPVFFRSVGLGLEDVAIASLLLDPQGAGTP